MTGARASSMLAQRSLSSLRRLIVSVLSFGVLSIGSGFVAFADNGPAPAIVVATAAAPHGEPSKKKTEEEAPVPPASAAPLSPAEQYCMNVEAAAVSARDAQQRKSLTQAQQEIEKRLKELADKAEEFKRWLKKRDDFLKKANDDLLEIYAKMKPDSAAAQLVAMNEITAAAIVSKLPPKAASLILAEMDAARAARLSSVLAAAAGVGERIPQKKAP